MHHVPSSIQIKKKIKIKKKKKKKKFIIVKFKIYGSFAYSAGDVITFNFDYVTVLVFPSHSNSTQMGVVTLQFLLQIFL
jgi:hypothetical protein